MLDILKYSEDEYIRLGAIVQDLARKFKEEWEHDPFLEPDVLEYLEVAGHDGGKDVRDELANVLEVYICYLAPEPKLTDEQFRARYDKVKELVDDYERRERASGANDGPNGSGDSVTI